jgi:peptidoglycan/LPS O-acetylase OafA/YrhL
MQISTVDPVFQTNLFIALLTLAVVLTVRRRVAGNGFDTTLTNELKGVAILMVIFSHVGYFLFFDHRFVYPLSVAGGKGVDIFLFLSGFGLTLSAFKSPLGLKDFYLKRLKKIFVPMWVVFAVFLIMDAVVLHKFYSFQGVVQDVLGFFPRADLYQDLDSPLWYFTLILFYYLLFPLIFSKRYPILSVTVLITLGYFVTRLSLPVDSAVSKLYRLHYLAFPLGVSLASLLQYKGRFSVHFPAVPRADALFAKFVLFALAVCTFGYTAIYSGVGENLIKEQVISLISLGCLLVIFLIKKVYSRFLTLLGMYSYEIYLIHWPLMYRYDFLYRYLPAFLSTFLYLVVFILLGIVLKNFVGRLDKYGLSPRSTNN